MGKTSDQKIKFIAKKKLIKINKEVKKEAVIRKVENKNWKF